jgi:hypothetical protein
MPFAFAVMLSLAAGLSLVEEHMRPMVAAGAAPDLPFAFANSLNKGPGAKVPHEGVASPNNGSAGAAGTTGLYPTSPGVGSRALTGNDGPDAAADQPEMATGADLKGPPMRFAPTETPE